MGFKPILRVVPACLAAGILLSGCAGTARGLKSSVYEHDDALSAVDISKSQADAMVIIRYPAVVDDEALNAYYRSFEQNAIGGTPELDGRVRQETDRVAQSIITKSNYYAMSLYREIRDKLPQHSVLLSPHVILLDDEYRLTSEPLLAAEQIPSVLTIDFDVYSFPDPREMMNSEPLTFGDIVTPLFVVHSNRWLRPSTNGLLLSSQPLVGSAWNQSESQADQQLLSRLNDTAFSYQRPLDFVAFLQNGYGNSRDLPLKSPGESRRDVVAVEVHPLEKIRMNSDTVAVLSRDSSVDPFAEDFVKGAATRIVAALNRADHDRATFFTRQIALSRFDPALGEAFLSRSRSEDIRARLLMGETLILAEKKFLSAQSESLYQGAYEGVYGDQMRQMIEAEYRMLEDRRELARAQNLSTALAVVAMAGAVYAGGNSDSSNFFRSSTMSNVAMLTSLWAMNSAFSKNAESKTVGENFLLQMAPAINRQVSVQVEWLESRQEITARDFAEFRSKTLALYQSSVRSVSAHTFDPSCRFSYPRIEQTGRWFGLCRDGLGISSGYGLIIDDQGNVVEFVGTAKAGLASGTGAMIVRSEAEAGAVYYEGGFSEGLPEGIVLVERPGRKPQVRQFRSGKDAGSADAEDLLSLQF
ncbi:MAG: hypothetical protein KJN69_09270 [Gammaproteobacteria bacterium]|nr:hypothetical protein [Gammaproteobacteria bacterium]